MDDKRERNAIRIPEWATNWTVTVQSDDRPEFVRQAEAWGDANGKWREMVSKGICPACNHAMSAHPRLGCWSIQ